MEQGKEFWIEFEQTDEAKETRKFKYMIENEENVMFSLSNYDNNFVKKKEFQSWLENQVNTKILDKGQTRISTR